MSDVDESRAQRLADAIDELPEGPLKESLERAQLDAKVARTLSPHRIEREAWKLRRCAARMAR